MADPGMADPRMADPVLAVVEKLRTLEEVTRWTLASGHGLVEVVTQDEYTHDVVVSAGARWLVFDTT